VVFESSSTEDHTRRCVRGLSVAGWLAQQGTKVLYADREMDGRDHRERLESAVPLNQRTLRSVEEGRASFPTVSHSTTCSPWRGSATARGRDDDVLRRGSDEVCDA
jgi:hypothetical protein